MPELVSTAEVGRTIAEHRAHSTRREEIIESIEALLLAVVAVSTAWCGYETARWDSRQSRLYAISAKDRSFATRAATRGGQEQLYDASIVSSWIEAKELGNTSVAQAFERRLRPEFRPIFEQWLRLDPLNNPNAPGGPTLMPQYRNAELTSAAVHDAQASAAYEEGTHARETGERFLRNTLLLSLVLFLTALASRFKVHAVRVAMISVAAVMLVVGVFFAVTYPIA